MPQPPRRALLALGGLAVLTFGILAGWYGWTQYQLKATRQALERFDFRAAQQHLDRARALGLSTRADFLAAQTARRRNAHAEAERLLTKCAQRYQPRVEVELEWLLLGVQQGDFAGQEDSLKARVDPEYPEAPLVLEALAKGYLNTFRWPDTVGSMDLLLQRQPGNVMALLLRGKGWEAGRQFDRALEDYRRAAALAPHHDEVRLCLADLLNRLGWCHEAIAHYEVLRQSQPAHPAVLLGLARCRFDARELDEAGRLLDALLTDQPDHVAGLVERGRLALFRGELQQAERILSRAARLAPWHREAHRFLLQCLEAAGRSAEARTCQARLDELEASDVQAGKLRLRFRDTPHDPGMRCDLGLWCLRNGEEQVGLRWLFSELLFNPYHGPTHAALADYFERTGQPRRAAEHRRRAKSDGPARRR